MAEAAELNYYILFANYTHGLSLQEQLSREGILARIAPAPRAIQGELSCGMSLLVKPEHIDAARAYIEQTHATHHAIVSLPCQIQPRRDRFC